MNSLFFRLSCLTVFSVIIGFASCTKENLEDMTAARVGGCDTINPISYNEDVIPILTSNGCLNSGCHDGTAGDLNLSDHTKLKTIALDNDRLRQAIMHTGNAKPMPLNGNKLDECSIAMIDQWIDEGCLKN